MGEPSSHRLRWAGSEASAEKVTSPTNLVAAGVSTGTTCTPASTSLRHTSTALYAAMPPPTPRITWRRSSRPLPGTSVRPPACPRRPARLAGDRSLVDAGRLGRIDRGGPGRHPTGRPLPSKVVEGCRLLAGGAGHGLLPDLVPDLVHRRLPRLPPRVDDLAGGDLLERDRQRLARQGGHLRGHDPPHALTEAVVVGVDLAGPPRSHRHQGELRVDLVQQLLDGRVHQRVAPHGHVRPSDRRRLRWRPRASRRQGAAAARQLGTAARRARAPLKPRPPRRPGPPGRSPPDWLPR